MSSLIITVGHHLPRKLENTFQDGLHWKNPNRQNRWNSSSEIHNFKLNIKSSNSTTNFDGEYSKQGKNVSKSDVLKSLICSPSIIQAPCCYDGISAKLLQASGFPVAVMSGFSVSAARLGQPDTGLLSYAEMVEQTHLIASAVDIPLIADADTGYGNVMNVKRTVKGYSQAGAGGLIIEDQVWPKACGHTRGRQVASREEAVMRIRAAVDARDELCNGDILVVARSDARQAMSLDEALWRAQAFADEGADMIFVDALTSREDMAALCTAVPHVPKMVNMLEGGKTPVLSPLELQDLGFQLVVYPLSLLGVSIRAMQDALTALKSGRLPPPGNLPSFEEIKSVVGFDEYYKEEARYSYSNTASPTPKSANSSEELNSDLKLDSGFQVLGDESGDSRPKVGKEVVNENFAGQVCYGDFECDDDRPAPQPAQSKAAPVYEVLEADVVEEGDGSNSSSNQSSSSTRKESFTALGSLWSRVLRIKITDKRGDVKLDVRVPAGFLDGLAATVPEVAGLNLNTLLKEKLKRNVSNEVEPVIDISGPKNNGDRVQVFIE